MVIPKTFLFYQYLIIILDKGKRIKKPSIYHDIGYQGLLSFVRFHLPRFNLQNEFPS